MLRPQFRGIARIINRMACTDAYRVRPPLEPLVARTAVRVGSFAALRQGRCMQRPYRPPPFGCLDSRKGLL